MKEKYPVESIISLAEALNVTNLGALPGAWECKVGAWTIAVNGHAEILFVKPDDCIMAAELEPFGFAVWFDGLLAGMLTLSGTGFFASGEEANPAIFAAAIERHIAKIQARGGD